MNDFIKHGKRTVAAIVIVAMAVALLVIVVDPYFHFHKPIDFLSYNIDSERYQNDGISRNFEYDTIITGSSMTLHMYVSKADELFNANTIRLTFQGGSFHEVDKNLRVAVENNRKIKTVIRSLDSGFFFDDANEMGYSDEDYPEYLYNGIGLDDVNYIFNKTVVLAALKELLYTAQGRADYSFDDYDPVDGQVYGNPNLSYMKGSSVESLGGLTEEEKLTIKKNITQNFIELIENNPQITFYLFIPPYSVFYWDKERMQGMLEKRLEAQKMVIEMLIPYDNVRLFAFADENIICDPANYLDLNHYSPEISEYILESMAGNQHRICFDNYNQYCDKMEKQIYNCIIDDAV